MDKIKSIILPTDFTRVSRNSIEYAIQLCKDLNARLKIFHAYQVPLAAEVRTGVVLFPSKEENGFAVKKNMEMLLAEYPEFNEIDHETEILTSSLLDATEKLITEEQCDLIIMGTKGAEGIKELFMGTNTAEIINNIEKAVLVIPGDVKYKKIRSIAFAYDFKGINESAKLNVLKILAEHCNAELHILNITESYKPKRDDDVATLETFDKIFSNITYRFKIELGDDIEKGINDYVKENDIDLLVALPRKHNFFEKIFKSSISKNLTFHTDIPLLMLKG